jgi:hypothetical protein
MTRILGVVFAVALSTVLSSQEHAAAQTAKVEKNMSGIASKKLKGQGQQKTNQIRTTPLWGFRARNRL